MSIAPLVKLYRESGTPHINDGEFSGTLKYQSCSKLLNSLGNNARVNDLRINDKPSQRLDKADDEDLISFSVQVFRRSSVCFYDDIDDFIRTNNLGRGEIPSGFYLVEDDYFDIDAESNAFIDQANTICGLVKCLSSLAHYHDEKTKSKYYKLVFVKPDELASAHPVVIETKIDKDILFLAGTLDIELIRNLSESTFAKDPHYKEKLGVFNNTIADFTQDRPEGTSSFKHLILNWNSFLDLYDKNLSLYLSGFAFHKVKREVAEAEVDLATKFSSIISDISGKLLGIPISLVAVLTIPSAGDVVKRTVIVLGLLIASYFMSEIIKNQSRRLRRISHSKDMILGAFEGKSETYPEDLKSSLRSIKESLDADQKKLERLLCLFKSLCWAPSQIAMIVYMFSFM